MNLEIITYSNEFEEKLMQIFDLLSPDFFDASERSDYRHYLRTKKEDYYIVLNNAICVAAGGINYESEHKKAFISWDIVHPDFHGKGIGRKLMQHRLKRIHSHSNAEQIIVRTSQLVYPFYEKQGFVLEKMVKDFWAAGFDLYQMSLEATKKI